MKNFNKYLLLFFVMAFTVSSCTDLEEDPVGVLAPESSFNTPADARNAAFGAYAQFASETAYGRKLTLSLQILSDMVDIGDPGTASRRISLNNFTHDSNNDMIGNFWPQLFSVVSAANAAIDGIPSIEMDEGQKNSLIAEARFARALAYYHLVRLFGPVPYIDRFVSDPSSLEDMESTPVGQVYENIISDLEYGMDHLPDTHNGGDVRSRATVGSAATLLASVHLTRENYSAAAEMAEFVINNSDRFNYGLVDDYQDLFIADNGDTEEHIFTIDFVGGVSGSWPENVDYMAPITGIRDADQQGWSVNVPSMEVYNSYNDDDYRKEVSFQAEAMIDGQMEPYTSYNFPRPHIAKFAVNPGTNANADGSTSDINYTVFRYAEVLLIAAEALNEVNSGPNAQAYDYINQVRERARNGNPGSFPQDLTTGLSQADFRDAVLEERRIELGFEFKRWYDIVRRDMLEEVFTGPNSLEPHSVDPSKHYLLPLPQDELNRNPNLRPDGDNNGY